MQVPPLQTALLEVLMEANLGADWGVAVARKASHALNIVYVASPHRLNQDGIAVFQQFS